MATSKTSRTIIFYELHPKIKGNKSFRNAIECVVKKIRANVKGLSPKYIQHGKNDYLIDVCSIDDKKEIIRGVIRSFTKENPELFHRKKLTLRDIEKMEDEDVVFSTHFVIRLLKDQIDLAIESGKEGPSYANLIYYLEKLGEKECEIERIAPVPHVKGSLDQLEAKLGRCSEFTVKVHKSKIKEVQKADQTLHEVLEDISNAYDSEYATMSLKYDYRNRQETNTVRTTIMNIVKYFKKNENNKATFESVQVKGEERSKDLKLDIFDLITDKLKSVVHAEKRENSKSIVSTDFLNAIVIELNEVIPVE